MNEVKTIIKSIVPKELMQDENVVASSFLLEPFMTETILKGDGQPAELSTTYQLDVFFKNKGELVAKCKQLVEALADYPMEPFSYIWESNARLYRGTTNIEIL